MHFIRVLEESLAYKMIELINLLINILKVLVRLEQIIKKRNQK